VKSRIRFSFIPPDGWNRNNDHLQGIEFLEKVTDNRKIISWKFYLKNIRNSKEQQEASKITKIEYEKL